MSSIVCSESKDGMNSPHTLHFEEFINNFEKNDQLNEKQNSKLNEILYLNKDVCVTKDNPSLGCKKLAKHHIILKQNFKPLHQRPNRLPPTKREVLRNHLDELLQQGVICKLDANEDAPITSPIVLIGKRMKSSDPKVNDRDSSLREYRFCVDYQYLNSQSETFIYNIQNLLELKESFTEREPNFIASIDLSTGFFQMKMSPDSSKYTAFNT